MITVADAELLERETELHTLRAQLDSARHGCGTITLVEAPAGQGKTTLLRAVRTKAAPRPAHVERDRRRPGARLRVRDRPPAAPGPRGHAGRCRPRPAARAVRAHRRPRRRAAAADRGRRRPLGRRRQPEDARDARTPDRAPADRARRGPAAGPARAAARRLFAAPAATVLHPAPLSPDAVAHLIETALDGELEPEFAAAAARSTGGNPLLGASCGARSRTAASPAPPPRPRPFAAPCPAPLPAWSRAACDHSARTRSRSRVRWPSCARAPTARSPTRSPG